MAISAYYKLGQAYKQKLIECKQLSTDLAAAKERERILIEALEWYQEKAIFIKDYLLKKKTDAVMAIVTELSLDNGTKARNALALVKKEK